MDLDEFGRILTADRVPNGEFSSEAVTAIVALSIAGVPKVRIAKAFRTNRRSTISNLGKRFIQRKSPKTKIRPGRPRKLTAWQERYLSLSPSKGLVQLERGLFTHGRRTRSETTRLLFPDGTPLSTEEEDQPLARCEAYPLNEGGRQSKARLLPPLGFTSRSRAAYAMPLFGRMYDPERTFHTRRLGVPVRLRTIQKGPH